MSECDKIFQKYKFVDKFSINLYQKSTESEYQMTKGIALVTTKCHIDESLLKKHEMRYMNNQKLQEFQK